MTEKTKSRFNYWLLGLLVVFLLSMIFHSSFYSLDPDFGWHYQVGYEIWQNKQVPQIEHHIFPLAGQNWVDHEWLANLIIYGLVNFGGYVLVTLFFASLLVLTWYLLTKETIKHWLNNQTGSVMFWLLLVIGLKASLPNLGVRAQGITLLFFLILNIWLAQAVRQRQWPWWKIIIIPIFFWFWTSLHGGYLVGLVVMIAWTVFHWLLRWIQRYWSQLKSSINLLPTNLLSRVTLTTLLSIIATTLTPYGLNLYKFLIDYYQNRAYLSLIKEWLPITTHPFSWPMFYLLAFGVALALLVIFWKNNYQSVRQWIVQQDWWVLILSLIMFVAAWSSRRHFPLFLVVSLPWLAGFFYQISEKNQFRPDQSPTYSKWLVVSCFILSIALFIVTTRWNNSPQQAYCSRYPCQAVKYLQQSPYRNWPTMFEYGWGGFLYWVWPDKPIFIDGRLPQYSWRDRSMIEHYDRFNYEDEIKQALDDYELSVVVISQPRAISFGWLESWLLGRGQQIEDYDSFSETMRRAMLKLPAWQLVYSDPVTLIYVKQ